MRHAGSGRPPGRLHNHDERQGEVRRMDDPSVWDRVLEMLRSASSGAPSFPPTVLYNENWMLRVVLDALVSGGTSSEAIPVTEGARWYSEALLPSAFLARVRGDPLAESYTHADGVIGQFQIGGVGKGDLVLDPNAKQLSVIEGKMLSGLSRGVKNAKYFDQAARNVACVAEVLRIAECPPERLEQVSFHVLAPRRQIESGVFEDLVTKESIAWKVEHRVEEFQGARDEWLAEWFRPTLDAMDVGLVSWEELVEEIAGRDAEFGGDLEAFYHKCLRFNASTGWVAS